MKNQSKTYLVFLFFILFSVKIQADTIDSLDSKPNKISIEFAGGVTYTNYTFKKVYDYYRDNLTIPDSLKNAIGKSFELNIQLPIKKSKFSIILGLGFTQRNFHYLVEEAYYKMYEPYLKSELHTNSYVSLLLGVGYKLVNVKHYALDASIGVNPSYWVREKVEGHYYQTYKPNYTYNNSDINSDMAISTKSIIAPLNFKINNSYKLNQHIAIGLSLGLFYDTVKPFPDNIIKNRLNYSSHLLLKYTF